MNLAFIFIIFVAAILLLNFGRQGSHVEGLAQAEICENCQRVLFYSFQYYRYTTTKRLLRHRVKHLCNRYFEYRRHCIVSLVPKVDQIWVDMERALDAEENREDLQYKPFKTCEKLKECDKEHSPITIPRVMMNLENARSSNENETTLQNEADAITSDYII